MADHSLTLGELLLTGSVPHEEHYFAFNVSGDGTSYGVAQGTVEVIRSLLADGDLVGTTRYGNREVTFDVEVEGPDLTSVAQGEASLRRAIGRGNTLTWQPPDHNAPATVFDVIDSSMAQVFDDLDELDRRRTFRVTLTCGPFARSKDPVTVDALVAGSTTVVFDTCDSATGWTGTYEGATAVVSTGWEAGSVGVAELDDTVTSPDVWTMTRTGSVDFTDTPYLVVEVRTLSSDAAPPLVVTVAADGSPVPLLSVERMTDSAYYRVTYDLSGAGVTSSLTFTHTSRDGEPWSGMFIREMARSDVPPGQTVRQQTRILRVGGTERTPGSIHVQSANGTDPLGLVIVETAPEDGSGRSPALRRWRTDASAGTETVDASALSGKTEPISLAAGGFNAKVPTSALPEGGYVLMARLRSLGVETTTVYWSTSTIFPDATDQQGYTNGNVLHAFPDADWQLIPLAALSLPSVRTSAGMVEISLQVIGTNQDVELDEAWLFRADEDCALTIVETDRPHLWLDSPDVSSPVPRVWVGDGMSTRVHPGEGLLAMGAHILSPEEGTAVFTAALSDNPATNATAYCRWPNNAAE